MNETPLQRGDNGLYLGSTAITVIHKQVLKLGKPHCMCTTSQDAFHILLFDKRSV